MRRALDLVLSLVALAGLPFTAVAQNPLKHFTDAFEVRYSARQPVLGYSLRVDSTDLSGFSVEIRIRNAADTVRLAMVTHPEYDDRYWRYVEGFQVTAPHGAMVVREDSTVWRVIAPGGESTVRYRIHLPPAEDGHRAGWRPFLSPTGGLVGGPHSFMYVVGATLAPAHVALDLPAGWVIATGLEPTADPSRFFAPSAFVLADSPMLVGRLRTWRYTEDGVPHQVAYWPGPEATPFDTAGLVGGLARLSHEAIALFGRAPYREYTFQLQDLAEGSLEHLNSVSVGAPSAGLAKGLTDLFSETAHEYFHNWNLMRIRPVEYGDVDYHKPPRARGLWWSEGITIYYADLLLRRAGLPTYDSTRVSHLERQISRYFRDSGNARFSPESVSVVSYGTEPGALGDYSASVHLQGELIGTMIDLMVRDATSGRRSLDDVIRLMDQRYSGAAGFTGVGVEQAVHDVCGCPVREFFARYVRTANSIDFNRYLGLAGLRVRVERGTAVDTSGNPIPDLRIFSWDPPGAQSPSLIVVDPAGIWGKAGLHTGDRLLRVNDLQPQRAAQFREWRMRLHTGDTVLVEVARQKRSVHATLVVTGFQRPTAVIEEIPEATEKQRQIRAQWLAGKP